MIEILHGMADVGMVILLVYAITAVISARSALATAKLEIKRLSDDVHHLAKIISNGGSLTVVQYKPDVLDSDTLDAEAI